MNRLLSRFTCLHRKDEDEAGQGLAEYALILVFVALACVMALQALGGAIASSPGFTTLPSVF
jgi:Flp pilus assembly pilin Flp